MLGYIKGLLQRLLPAAQAYPETQVAAVDSAGRPLLVATVGWVVRWVGGKLCVVPAAKIEFYVAVECVVYGLMVELNDKRVHPFAHPVHLYPGDSFVPKIVNTITPQSGAVTPLDVSIH
jgi:hypothetical protein